MEAYRQYHSLGSRLEAQLHRTRGANNATPTSNTELPDVDLEAPSSDSTDVEDNTSQLDPIERPLSKIGTNLAAALTGITKNQTSDTKVFVVGFEGPNDPLNPRNWSLAKRIFCTLNVGIIALVVGMAASIDSAVISRAAKEFGVSDVAEALATGLVSCHWHELRLRYIFLANMAFKTVPCWLWLWRSHCRSIIGNGRPKSRLFRLLGDIHAVYYGSGIIEKLGRAASVSLLCWILWRVAVIDRWGVY